MKRYIKYLYSIKNLIVVLLKLIKIIFIFYISIFMNL
jgi:hypothetical protein